MKPIKLNYAAFWPMDIFLTHDNSPKGRIIRLAQTEKPDPNDDRTPTHGGFVFPMQAQYLACQMNPGLKLETLDQYTGRLEQIVEVWRYTQWEPERMQAALERLAYLIRKNKEQTRYDLWGAILSSPLGKRVFGRFPFAKNKSTRWFCTEAVCDILREYADSLIGKALSPLDLSLYFQRRGKPYYEKVTDWKK